MPDKPSSSMEISFIQANKSTVHLGSDAAASYYFSDEPKTPAIHVAKKKLENKHRLSKGQSFLSESGLTFEEENLNPNQSFLSTKDAVRKNSVSNMKEYEESSDADTACLLADSTVDSSCLSVQETHEDDTLNKSVLSDTTELKASIFVFSAESRQRLIDEKMFARRNESKAKEAKVVQTLGTEYVHGNDCMDVGQDDTLELISGVIEDKKEIEENEIGEHVYERGSNDETASIADFQQILRMVGNANDARATSIATLPSRSTDDTYELLNIRASSEASTLSDVKSNNTVVYLMSDDTSELLNWKNFVGSPSLTAVHFGDEGKDGQQDDLTVDLFERASRGGFDYSRPSVVPLALDTPDSQISFKDKASSIRSLTASLKKASHIKHVNKERRLSRLSLANPTSDSPMVDVVGNSRPSVGGIPAFSPSFDANYSVLSSSIDHGSTLADTTEICSQTIHATTSGSKRKLSSTQASPEKSKRTQNIVASSESKNLFTDLLADSSMSSDTSLLVSPVTDNMNTLELINSHRTTLPDDEDTASTGEINQIVGDLMNHADTIDRNDSGFSFSITHGSRASKSTIELASFLDRFDDQSKQPDGIKELSFSMDSDTSDLSVKNKSALSLTEVAALTSDSSAMTIDEMQASMKSDYDSCSPPSDRIISTTKLATPKSILNSSRRGDRLTSSNSVARKSVAFGSPEYAQYNIGSPSTNLTPMLPKERTMLRPIEEDDMNSSQGEDKTSELESDLADLLMGIDKSAIVTNGNQFNRSLYDQRRYSDSNNFPVAHKLSDNSATIELESDMNAVLTAAGKSFACMTSAEDQTIELDSNINQLLNDVANQLNSHNSQGTTSDLNSVHDNRRLSTMSISMEDSFSMDMDSHRESYEYLESLLTSQLDSRPPSRRVSLAPRMSLSFLSPGSDEHESTSNSIGLIEQDKSDHLTSVEENIILDLSWEEIASQSNIFGRYSSTLRNVVGDMFLGQLAFALSQSQGVFIRDELQGFLHDACETMERYAESETVDGESIIQGMLRGDEKNMLMLQRSMRGEDPDRQSILNKLASLSDLASLIVSTEIRHWEAEVTEALLLSLTKLLHETDDELNQINRGIKLADDVDFSLSVLSGQNIRRARRKSMSRRKISVESMQNEIAQLEKQLALEQETVSSLRVQNDRLQTMGELSNLQTSLEDDCQRRKMEAESNLSLLKSLELIHNVTLNRAENSSITVRVQGYSNDLCICLQFCNSPNGFVCRSEPKKKDRNRMDLYSLSPTGFYAETVKEFLNHASSWYIQRVIDCTYPSTADVHEAVMNLSSFFNRLQLISKEMMNLTRRYTGKLSWNDDFSAIDFSLLFGQRKNGRKYEVIGCFHFDLSYPFSPLEVDITGEAVVIEDLEQHLVKNAKPGFGYLTRSCDVISAFIRSSI